ncbi:NAD-dependent epimerase/dehydratase family protein [Planotetraspora sp. A-T 1434]|uniref:NAD-dependent epimerase/dehydratase family protein n=1 Tax=Planotetraspora sp. A-T 1434 TaxID=2979219 RepID=UPI0021BF71EB|nr:NAD-dependent epimerase/dehydratase family protein [Planotetraspora sp. A-T 1434]MCT9933004.1 NAD-dependent epimerase/dehydratase family protein [Planotetraspora sp. A-T 1434]
MGKHVIVGAGQVGGQVAELLADQGHEVVVVTRSGSGPVRPGISLVAAQAGDAATMRRLTEEADALYNCANPAYHRWPVDWPPIANALLEAAEATGAGLVILGNLYGYGPVDGPMTEDLPLASTGTKGRVRAAMWEQALAAQQAGRVRATEVRGSDYYGPQASDQSYLGERFVPPLLAGKPAMVLSDPDVPHSWTYLPDVARALVAVAGNERAWGRAWHVPTSPAVTIRTIAERLCALAGAPAPRLRRIPWPLIQAAGLVAPFIRELKETRYQFDRPFVLDSSASEAALGLTPTPLDEALKAVIAQWRTR